VFSSLARAVSRALVSSAAAIAVCGACTVAPPAQVADRRIGVGAAAHPAAHSAADPIVVHGSVRDARGRSAPYRGLGTWVDIYDHRQLARPSAAVRRMDRRGVRTLFVETANYASPRAVVHKRAMRGFLHAAHKRGMRVIAWYLPSFADLRLDRARSLAAIDFRTRRGHRFDGFGLDIEATTVRSVPVRLRRLLRLSHQIRRAAGHGYSLGAITPSPYGMRAMPGYWGRVGRFPFRELARVYDVVAPMSYFTYRVHGARAVSEYVRYNIRTVRRLSGNRSVRVHPVGGIANETNRREVRAYVRVVRHRDALGGSLYDFPRTTREHWRVLGRIPPTSR